MSFNFTGTTGRKRNINLGGRSLTPKNKSIFLKTAQLERERRERQRTEMQSAVFIQSACRRYLDLKRTRGALSESWGTDGSIGSFVFFFPYVVKEQDKNRSIEQLRIIESIVSGLSEHDLEKLIETLALTFTKLGDPSFSPVLSLSILKVMDVIFEKLPKFELHCSLAQQFAKCLLKAYIGELKQALYYIMKFSEHLPYTSSIETLTYKFIDPLADSSKNKWNVEYDKFLMYILKNPDSEQCFKTLDQTSAITLVVRLSESIHTYPELVISKEAIYPYFFRNVAFLLDLVDYPILVQSEEEMAVDYKSTLVIPNRDFESLKLLYETAEFDKFQRLQPSNDILLDYISSLLHFSSLIKNDRSNTLKLRVDLNWILRDKNSFLISECFNRLSVSKLANDFLNFAELQKFIKVQEYNKWWNAMLIFQEYLLNLLTFSTNENFFSLLVISKEQFLAYTNFLKVFVSEILLKYRDVKIENQSRKFFLSSFKKLLTLLHGLYMKDLKLKFTSDYNSKSYNNKRSFWILSKFDLDINSVVNIVPIIDQLHQSLLEYDEGEQENNEENDYLREPHLLSFLKSSPPKKVIDSLYLLTYAPYMIPFEKRAEIFHAFIEYDKRDNDINSWFPTKIEGVISRDNILFDAYKYYGKTRGKDFKRPFAVQFINHFGEAEAGIDGGGLTKELLTSVVSCAMTPSESNRQANKGLEFFRIGTDYHLYFNPEFYFKLYYEREQHSKVPYACSNEEYLHMCHFLGMVIGKCLYSNILLDVSFTSFFLITCAKMGGQYFRNLVGDKVDFIGYSVSLDELKNIDEALYQSVNYILKQTEESKFKSMGIQFSVDDEFYDINGKKYHVSIPLLRNKDGSVVEVTNGNKMQFARMLASFKLSKQNKLEMKSFVDGLFQVIRPHWLLLFNPIELQTLISGDDEIDIEDLRRNVVYGGGYTEEDQTIKDLFEILHEFDHENRSKFIKYVTSSSKQPLLGFKELDPHFGIFNAGADTNRLPTASTCVNLLKLPNYKDKDQLRRKLLYAITSNAGFDLS